MVEEHIKLTSIGFDKRSIHTLSQALIAKTKGSCTFASDSDAEIILVNLDAGDINALYKNFRKKNGIIPAVGICKKIHSEWDIRQIVKPVSTEDLLKTIEDEIAMNKNLKPNKITEDKIAAAMSAIDSRNVTKGLGKRRDDNSNKNSSVSPVRGIPRKTDEMCFDIERFLLGHVIDASNNAKLNNKLAVIKCWGNKIIIIDPQASEVITDVKENQLRTMAIAPLEDTLSSPIKIEYLDEKNKSYLEYIEKEGMLKVSFEVFMWNLGSMTCRGRIPIDASISERQYLSRWPNVTRINLGDNALRIISYWVKQPCGLYDIQQALDVSLHDVFSVYTAALSAGLCGEAKREADHLLDINAVRKNTKRGLFGTIVKRLKKMSHKAA